jgi:hypothetical protein
MEIYKVFGKEYQFENVILYQHHSDDTASFNNDYEYGVSKITIKSDFALICNSVKL